MDKIYVKAAPGTQCPHESCNVRHKSFSDKAFSEVVPTSYIKSLIREGSLIQGTAEDFAKQQPQPQPEKPKKGGK